MGDGNKRHGSLADILAVQISLAVLGDNILNIPARQGNPRSLLQQGNNARCGAVPGGGLQGENGFPPRSHGGAADKAGLAADAAVKERANGFCSSLPRQIHLECAVDGNHILMPGDEKGIVCIVDLFQLDGRMIIDELITRL